MPKKAKARSLKQDLKLINRMIRTLGRIRRHQFRYQSQLREETRRLRKLRRRIRHPELVEKVKKYVPPELPIQ